MAANKQDRHHQVTLQPVNPCEFHNWQGKDNFSSTRFCGCCKCVRNVPTQR